MQEVKSARFKILAAGHPELHPRCCQDRHEEHASSSITPSMDHATTVTLGIEFKLGLNGHTETQCCMSLSKDVQSTYGLSILKAQSQQDQCTDTSPGEADHVSRILVAEERGHLHPGSSLSVHSLTASHAVVGSAAARRFAA